MYLYFIHTTTTTILKKQKIFYKKIRKKYEDMNIIYYEKKF